MNQLASAVVFALNDSIGYFSRLFAPENLPNLILCIIGIAAVIAAVRTLKVIKAQTEATKRSVTLQETAMKQWVVFKDWNHEVRKESEDKWSLTVSFDIVNPTDWLMALVATVMQVRVRESMTNYFNIPLAPNVPYRVEMSGIPISYEQYLGQGSISFVLFGAVTYLDCFGNPQNYIFSGFLWCAKDRQTTFRMEWFPGNPYGQQEKQESPKTEHKQL